MKLKRKSSKNIEITWGLRTVEKLDSEFSGLTEVMDSAVEKFANSFAKALPLAVAEVLEEAVDHVYFDLTQKLKNPLQMKIDLELGEDYTGQSYVADFGDVVRDHVDQMGGLLTEEDKPYGIKLVKALRALADEVEKAIK